VFCDDPVMLYRYLDLSRRRVQDLWNDSSGVNQ
jgi:hypothetical protein